jgi:hypothetical protein
LFLSIHHKTGLDVAMPATLNNWKYPIKQIGSVLKYVPRRRLLLAGGALPFCFGGQSNLDQAANSFGA